MWIVVIVSCVAGGVAYYFIWDDQMSYRSAAQVFVGSPALKSKTKKESPAKEQFIDHVEAMKTELIGSMVAYDLLLYDLVEKTPFRNIGQLPMSERELDVAKTRLREKLASFEQLTPLNPFENKLINILKLKRYEIARWVMEEDLTIQRLRDSDFIMVEFSSENPFLSAFVVNSLCNEFIRYNNGQENGNMPSDSVKALGKLVQQKKEILDSNTSQLNQLKLNYTTVVNSPSQPLRSQYQEQLRSAERKKQRLATLLKDLQTRISNFESPSPENFGSRKKKLLELESKITELQSIYKQKGSRDENLAGTINDLEKQFHAEKKRIETESREVSEKAKEFRDLLANQEKLESEYKLAGNQYASLHSRISSLGTKKATLPGSETTLTLLTQVRDSALEAYNSAVENYNDARKNPSYSNSQMELVIRGQPNAEPESSSAEVLTILLIAGGCGIFSLAIILIKEGLRSQRTTNYTNLTVVR
jgi:hypothetical protein